MTAPGTRRFPPVLGAETEPVSQLVDARWLMAYAAGLGETAERFYDTPAPTGPVAHPLFPVCYEWPPLVSLRERVIGGELAPLVRDGLGALAAEGWVRPDAPDRVWTAWKAGSTHWSRPWGLSVLGHFLRAKGTR